jgi:hypothetical protein
MRALGPPPSLNVFVAIIVVMVDIVMADARQG